MLKIFNRKKDLTEKKILLFIGSPRTGSTILGQILNYHPNCLISNESRFANRVIQKDENLNNVLNDVYNEALSQYKTSLENDKKFGKTIKNYQPRWKSMSYLLNDNCFKKKEIIWIGDKKAGGLSEVYITNKEKTIQFLKSNNYHLIQIIRNPIDAANSLMKSHGVSSFEKACEEIVQKSSAADELIKSINNSSHQIYYEDLLSRPKEEITKILRFLNLSDQQEWIQKVSSVLSKDIKKNYSEQEFEISKNLIIKYDKNLILKRYI